MNFLVICKVDDIIKYSELVKAEYMCDSKWNEIHQIELPIIKEGTFIKLKTTHDNLVSLYPISPRNKVVFQDSHQLTYFLRDNKIDFDLISYSELQD